MPVFLTRRREDAKENAGCCRGRVGEHEHEHALYSCPIVVQITSPAKSLQGRSRAGKPELLLFVSIRVHSWFKTPLIRGSKHSAQRKTFEAYRLEGSSLQQGLSGTCCIVGSVLRRAACLSELAIAFSRRQPGLGFSGRNHFCSRKTLYATTVPKAKIPGQFFPQTFDTRHKVFRRSSLQPPISRRGDPKFPRDHSRLSDFVTFTTPPDAGPL